MSRAWQVAAYAVALAARRSLPRRQRINLGEEAIITRCVTDLLRDGLVEDRARIEKLEAEVEELRGSIRQAVDP